MLTQAISATCFLAVLAVSNGTSGQAEQEPIVIAHRGASGYLPEHTLAATALAHGMGADYIEQDVVLSKDGVPFIVHDITLNATTNVKSAFPGRHRDDGKYYVLDFTSVELKSLAVTERVDLKTGRRVFPSRFPLHSASFQIPTLAEAVEMIQGINKSTGRTVGIYPEIKRPQWHRQQGHDISAAVLKLLQNYGYTSRKDPIFLQCFDAEELIRIRHQLHCKLKLIQLIGSDEWHKSKTNYSQMTTKAGIEKVAQYADGIGPWLHHLVAKTDQGKVTTTPLIEHANAAKLVVHPFTFRKDDLPEFATSFEELIELFRANIKVDGYFTDHPDTVAKLIGKSKR